MLPGITIMMLLPILAICCWMRCVAPEPIATVAMTEATPITIPSMVSAERSLFIFSARNAIRMEEIRCFMTTPQQQYARRQLPQAPLVLPPFCR